MLSRSGWKGFPWLSWVGTVISYRRVYRRCRRLPDVRLLPREVRDFFKRNAFPAEYLQLPGRRHAENAGLRAAHDHARPHERREVMRIVGAPQADEDNGLRRSVGRHHEQAYPCRRMPRQASAPRHSINRPACSPSNVHRLMNKIETAIRRWPHSGAEATPAPLPPVAGGRPRPLRRRKVSLSADGDSARSVPVAPGG